MLREVFSCCFPARNRELSALSEAQGACCMAPDRLDAIHAWLQQADEALLYTPQEETLAEGEQGPGDLVAREGQRIIDGYVAERIHRLDVALARLVNEGHYTLDDLAVVSFVPYGRLLPESYICRAAD